MFCRGRPVCRPGHGSSRHPFTGGHIGPSLRGAGRRSGTNENWRGTGASRGGTEPAPYREKQIDGEWMGLIQYNQREMTEPSYDLWPGESAEYETEWGDLEEGEYRYVVPFTVIEDEDEAPGQRYCTVARFTI